MQGIAATVVGAVSGIKELIAEIDGGRDRQAGLLLDESNNLATKATELQQQADALVRHVEAG